MTSIIFSGILIVVCILYVLEFYTGIALYRIGIVFLLSPILFIIFIKRKDSLNMMVRYSWRLPAIFILMYVSSIWALDSGRAINQTIYYAYSLAVYFSVFLYLVCFGNKWVLWLSYIFTIACFFAVISIYAEFGVLRATASSDYKLLSLGSVSNQFPAIMLLMSSFPMMKYIQEGSKQFFLAIPFLITAFVVLLAESRSALIALIFIAFLLGIKAKLFKFDFKSIIILLFIYFGLDYLLSLGSISHSVEGVVDRFRIIELSWSELLRGILAFEDMSGTKDYARISMYQYGVKAAFDHPILGVGFDNLYIFMEMMGVQGLISHNVFISIYSELGILGLILFSLLFYTTFKSLRRAVINTKEFEIDSWWLFSAAEISFYVILLQWLFRPQIGNVAVYIIFGIAAYSIYFNNKCRAKARQ